MMLLWVLGVKEVFRVVTDQDLDGEGDILVINEETQNPIEFTSFPASLTSQNINPEVWSIFLTPARANPIWMTLSTSSTIVDTPSHCQDWQARSTHICTRQSFHFPSATRTGTPSGAVRVSPYILGKRSMTMMMKDQYQLQYSQHRECFPRTKLLIIIVLGENLFCDMYFRTRLKQQLRFIYII